MGQGRFTAAGKAGKLYQGASVAVEAVAVGLFDAPLKWKYVVFHFFYPFCFAYSCNMSIAERWYFCCFIRPQYHLPELPR